MVGGREGSSRGRGSLEVRAALSDKGGHEAGTIDPHGIDCHESSIRLWNSHPAKLADLDRRTAPIFTLKRVHIGQSVAPGPSGAYGVRIRPEGAAVRTAPATLMAGILIGGLTLSACGGSAEPETVLATATSVPSSALPSESALGEVTAIDAQNACEDYYSLNLKFLQLPSLSKQEQRDAVDELVRIATDLTGTAADAVSAQELPGRVQPNAERIAKMLSSLPPKATYKDLPKKKRVRIVASSGRIEKACVRNGFDVPDENLAARE